jgi:hypothetical protein
MDILLDDVLAFYSIADACVFSLLTCNVLVLALISFSVLRSVSSIFPTCQHRAVAAQLLQSLPLAALGRVHRLYASSQCGMAVLDDEEASKANIEQMDDLKVDSYKVSAQADGVGKQEPFAAQHCQTGTAERGRGGVSGGRTAVSSVGGSLSTGSCSSGSGRRQRRRCEGSHASASAIKQVKGSTEDMILMESGKGSSPDPATEEGQSLHFNKSMSPGCIASKRRISFHWQVWTSFNSMEQHMPTVLAPTVPQASTSGRGIRRSLALTSADGGSEEQATLLPLRGWHDTGGHKSSLGTTADPPPSALPLTAANLMR